MWVVVNGSAICMGEAARLHKLANNLERERETTKKKKKKKENSYKGTAKRGCRSVCNNPTAYVPKNISSIYQPMNVVLNTRGFICPTVKLVVCDGRAVRRWGRNGVVPARHRDVSRCVRCRWRRLAHTPQWIQLANHGVQGSEWARRPAGERSIAGNQFMLRQRLGAVTLVLENCDAHKTGGPAAS